MEEDECPVCESEEVDHLSRDEDADVLTADRECEDCGTRWSYVTPTWVGWAYLSAGILLLLLMFIGGRWAYRAGLAAHSAAAAEEAAAEASPLDHTRLTMDAVWSGTIVGLAAGVGIGMLGVIIKIMQHGVAVTCNNAGEVKILEKGSPPEKEPQPAAES